MQKFLKLLLKIIWQIIRTFSFVFMAIFIISFRIIFKLLKIIVDFLDDISQKLYERISDEVDEEDVEEFNLDEVFFHQIHDMVKKNIPPTIDNIKETLGVSVYASRKLRSWFEKIGISYKDPSINNASKITPKFLELDEEEFIEHLEKNKESL